MEDRETQERKELQGLGHLPELAAVAEGLTDLVRKDGVQQKGVSAVQDAFLGLAAREQTETGCPSLLRVNLGPANAFRGVFGPGTERVVIELQRRVGLSPNGRIDAQLLAAIDNEFQRASRCESASTEVKPPERSTTTITHSRFGSIPTFGDVLAGRVILGLGDHGPAISALQQALHDMGFPMRVLRNGVGTSAVDGFFGSQTETALRNFQVHAQSRHVGVRADGILEGTTMTALTALAPELGRNAWDDGQPNHAPIPCWNREPSKKLRIVVVKDEHRTFLFDGTGRCLGIFPNAHGSPGNETDTGLKKVRTKLGEEEAESVGKEMWDSERAFGKRILDLSWASGAAHGEELHGTYDYKNIGKDVSHGCVRHYNEDIVTMFDAVNVGSYVAIVSSVDDPLLRA